MCVCVCVCVCVFSLHPSTSQPLSLFLLSYFLLFLLLLFCIACHSKFSRCCQSCEEEKLAVTEKNSESNAGLTKKEMIYKELPPLCRVATVGSFWQILVMLSSQQVLLVWQRFCSEVKLWNQEGGFLGTFLFY